MGIRPICKVCKYRYGRLKHTNKSGRKVWKSKCYKCSKEPYRRLKKGFCEFCGFIPVDSCQLDLDHIDGNHKNNDKSNLQTLCANCHRLKTYLNKDWGG